MRLTLAGTRPVSKGPPARECTSAPMQGWDVVPAACSPSQLMSTGDYLASNLQSAGDQLAAACDLLVWKASVGPRSVKISLYSSGTVQAGASPLDGSRLHGQDSRCVHAA